MDVTIDTLIRYVVYVVLITLLWSMRQQLRILRDTLELERRRVAKLKNILDDWREEVRAYWENIVGSYKELAKDLRQTILVEKGELISRVQQLEEKLTAHTSIQSNLISKLEGLTLPPIDEST